MPEDSGCPDSKCTNCTPYTRTDWTRCYKENECTQVEADWFIEGSNRDKAMKLECARRGQTTDIKTENVDWKGCAGGGFQAKCKDLACVEKGTCHTPMIERNKHPTHSWERPCILDTDSGMCEMPPINFLDPLHLPAAVKGMNEVMSNPCKYIDCGKFDDITDYAKWHVKNVGILLAILILVGCIASISITAHVVRHW